MRRALQHAQLIGHRGWTAYGTHPRFGGMQMAALSAAGPFGRARRRLRNLARPNVLVTGPPEGVRLDRDVEVVMRDGTVLRVNVFRPAGDDRPRPVLMSAHPYGKDYMPRKRRGGYRPFPNLRVLPQSTKFTISAWTGWEAPDPGYWVAAGYIVINADLRGWGRSDGTGELFSPQEGIDYHDLIEWAAAQPWCTGRVGLTGVSYLATSQWAAATQPPHLAAICPWEGFTSLWDVARPGGVREDGLMIVWTRGTSRSRPDNKVDFRAQQKARDLHDPWWAARDQELDRIEVPALVCASFSDHNLHSKGAFEGFAGIASKHKWLYTHRGPKWAEYYGARGVKAQRRFFDTFLKDADTGHFAVPPVRLEVRSDADTITSVRDEQTWPPTATAWESWNLHPDGRLDAATPSVGSRSMRTRGSAGIHFRHDIGQDIEIVGPMRLHLPVSLAAGGDACLFVGVHKVRDGKRVAFENAYGFRGSLLTHGIRRASHHFRGTDGNPRDDIAANLIPDQIVQIEIEVLPSATLFEAGSELQLEIRGQWFYGRNPLTGQFPAYYERSRRGRCTLHLGPDTNARLEVPIQMRPGGTITRTDANQQKPEPRG